jgi:hypothetical protein
MTDEDFLRALESCTLPESEFGHHAHVRAGYLYLNKSNFAEALVRMRRSICAYATHLGKSDRYHETITIAYLALIQQCIVERGDGGGWATFAQSNPELFNPELLGNFYDRDVLESTLARRVFLLPRSKPCHGKLPANNDEPRL